jgi:hypothetical protein
MAIHLLRAVLESFDEANWQCDIRPLEAPAALFTQCPIVEDVPGELLAAGATVLAVASDDATALVLGPYGARPQAPRSAAAYDGTGQDFTSTAYTSYGALGLSLTLRVTSYLWWFLNATARGAQARAQHAAISLYVDGVQELPPVIQGFHAANAYEPVIIAARSQSSYAPGSHTLDVQAKVYNAGDTLNLRYATLSVLALPT